jgi:3-methyladenine DNA glycosylase AlkD
MNNYSTLFREALARHHHPENALQMKQYMRNQYDFFGIKAPERKSILNAFITENGYPKDLPATVKAWWAEPEREFQLCAMELMERRKRQAIQNWVDTYKWMITQKSWWDTVDFIATKQVGYHFQRFPEIQNEYINAWMDSENIWLQRTCLLFQLKYKTQTNWELLQQLINELKDSREFFIRKAIGWALREYSKTYPDRVANFVSATALSGLSEREALKVIRKNSGF